MSDISGRDDPLAGYLEEAAMAAARDVSRRKLRQERQIGAGPPFVKLDRRVLYPIADFRRWLEAITLRPAGRRSAAANHRLETV